MILENGLEVNNYMEKMKLSFVIPCYGSERTIARIVNGIIETVLDKNPYEIICVNDCSPDGVYKVLENLALTNKNIKVINLAKNFGQHNAMMAGYHYVTGDIIITLDDDGQTDPHFCYSLIDAIDENTDVVYAKYPSKKHSLFRNFGTWITKLMKVWLCEWPKELSSTSYFAAKRFIIDEIIKYENPYTFQPGLIIRTTRKIKNVTVEHHKREYGKSGYTFKKLLNLWVNGFTQFSVKPLRIATFCGGIVATFGFIFALVIIIRKLLNPAITVGYSSIMCALLFIGGVLMLMLGLIGEYIGRIYICMNQPPQFVIRNTINIDEK